VCIKNVHYTSPKGNRTRPFIFSLLFCCSLLAGAGAADISSALLVPMLIDTLVCPVSAAGLFFSLSLPLVLSAIVSAFHKPAFLFPITAFRAFYFGYCSEGIFLYCHEAGWLIQFLFLFSAIFSFVPFLWLCLRNIGGVSRNWKRDFSICCAAVVLFGSFDYFFVSPFLAALMR